MASGRGFKKKEKLRQDKTQGKPRQGEAREDKYLHLHGILGAVYWPDIKVEFECDVNELVDVTCFDPHQFLSFPNPA